MFVVNEDIMFVEVLIWVVISKVSVMVINNVSVIVGSSHGIATHNNIMLVEITIRVVLGKIGVMVVNNVLVVVATGSIG